MRGFICGALLALTVTTATAEEDFHSANFKVPFCKQALEALARHDDSYGNRFFQGECIGIVETVRNMLFAIHETAKEEGTKVNQQLCANIPPNNVTNEQTVKIVVNFTEQHPEVTHLDFGVLVLVALRTAWPCKN